MKPDVINRWLTLAANFGVLIGIILLLVELNQNATMMKAQISNERAGQAISIFLAIAESEKLSGIEAGLKDAGFPENASAINKLSHSEQMQYVMFLQALRYRIESVLYQQVLGVVTDPEAISSAKVLVPKLRAAGTGDTERLEALIVAADTASD